MADREAMGSGASAAERPPVRKTHPCRYLKPSWPPRILGGSRKHAPPAIRVSPKSGVLTRAWGNPTAPGTGEDQVEAALARALDRASEAGRFDVVAKLARELEARRQARRSAT